MNSSIELRSPVFGHQEPIPCRFTGEGQDVSPPLVWSGVPTECREFALVCLDPDAPIAPNKDHPFVHWVIYNISPATSSLPDGVPGKARLQLPLFADQGLNSFGKIGYGGPMPPPGHGTHHYHFVLYALDRELNLRPGASHPEFLRAIENHVLATTELVGTYQRVAEEKPAKKSDAA